MLICGFVVILSTNKLLQSVYILTKYLSDHARILQESRQDSYKTRKIFPVYTQTSVFSYSLFYLQNQINNYKQTTKSTVCVNYDYTTGCNTAVIQFCGKKSAKFPGKSWHITEQFTILLSHNLLCTASST